MTVFLSTSVRPGVELLCIDTDGLDLGLIEVGKTYMVEEVYISPPDAVRTKYKGYPAKSELGVSLCGISRTEKPSGRYEGGTFSLRRFIKT